MNNKAILTFLLISCISFHLLFAQEITQTKTEFGYGVGFLASTAQTHNILFQKNIFQKNKWRINAELAVTFGGPWGMLHTSGEEAIPVGTKSPYQIYAAGFGANLYKSLLKKRNFEVGLSAGILLGYEYYVVSEVVESTSTPLGGSLLFWNLLDNGLSATIPIRLIATKLFKKRSLSLSPAYYYMGRAEGNVVLFLTMGI